MPTPAPSSRRLRRVSSMGVAALVALGLSGATAHADVPSVTVTSEAPSQQQVFFVGNNWSGNVTVIRPDGDYGKLGDINMIPDKTQRELEIYLNPVRLAAYLYIQRTAGEGHNQYVDDMYSTPDGSSIVASRPSYADVVSINTTTGAVEWRFPVSGFRSDHMALSPDGTQVAVSASSGNVVHVLDIETGRELGRFPTGDKPHENVYIDGGRYIVNSAIGNVETGQDARWQDFTKGDRKLVIADAQSFEVVRTIDMRPLLDAFGRKDLSDSVRPMAFSPDESKLYFQVSFFAGLVEYDVDAGRITRVADLPKNPAVNPDRTTWVNDSRHHGLAMSADGSKLCVAGTMDDYATIVDRRTLTAGSLIPAGKPYWATISPDGKRCIISESATDTVTAIDFGTGQRVATVPVGDHPQRVRLGSLPEGWSGTSR
ncbi:serine/threonine protein kinase [Knoellia sinensis KCTC 19936]|uniref:Serine/threonine protein kinase n=1 Tax=Knoellia sinensis KCTC 19936 TaxID=1385520 RepID=A0A0A0JC63_9MICO|nr:PQQ-binding-like beta-propeller repeat protein [Knoellia sinensis]KGN33226.1 serine/threonine protein kinase [Knoellia sinensis KCTC 19936]